MARYRSTKCSAENTLKEVCSQFFGDTPVITLFRANPQPEPCPFRGPFNFTYENYRGSCKTRISTGDFCVSSSKLKLNYQSCPETYLSESKVEFIECVARWTSDRYNFFAGKLLGKSSFSEADNFRCFTYELSPRGGVVSISADASCQELTDIDTAAVRLEFQNEHYPTAQCSFMHWLVQKHNEKNRPRLWESLHSTETYHFQRHELVVYDTNSRSNTSISTCIQADNFGAMSQFVLYTVNGCDHGYTCMKVYRRTPYVIEILQGSLATVPYLACTKEYFDESSSVIGTYLGTYNVEYGTCYE
ncbi:unnamed protein product [Soboliphyme baturini]|uniref:CUB domain-containing protein n=1 Tax=Soboliphyme baturini TaxID=241478 RepID=A0A183IQW4_9BILA|nr:unnamed protein product [Soboliphyme baturini]